MEEIKSFEQVYDHLGSLSSRKRIAVVCPDDECTQSAILMALDKGLADFILVSTPQGLQSLPDRIVADADHVKTIEVADSDAAAMYAADACRIGESDIMMKGLINTDNFLRAILNKEKGLLPKGNVLTHLSVAEMPSYHKLLFFSDVAVIPYPTLQQREAMLCYDIATCRKFGISRPKIALIHFTEKVNEKFPNSVDYVKLEEMAGSGRFGEVYMAGPMDVKTACDRHSAEVKGIESPVCGDADLLIFPNIESGNTFYKTITLFAGATIAGILQGAVCPVILTSRSDNTISKLSSMAIACMNAL
ncbi:MAG: phosphate butyryltransferase [Bacteroidales bacterium]|nr:phosphate butyryltransferase [Bacteroidales bacterium]